MKTPPDNLGIPPSEFLSEAPKGPESYQAIETPTLRDQFALAALTGLLGKMTSSRYHDILGGIQGGLNEAKVAYRLADAMLEARKK